MHVATVAVYLQKSFIILNDLSTFGITTKRNRRNIFQLIASDKTKNYYFKSYCTYTFIKKANLRRFPPEI